MQAMFISIVVLTGSLTRCSMEVHNLLDEYSIMTCSGLWREKGAFKVMYTREAIT